MLITTHQKRASLNVTEINLHLNDENLSMISKDKVLGIFIDDNLTWKSHIEHNHYVEKFHPIFGFCLELSNT